MTPLGPGQIRARNRPFVVLSIAGLRLVLALCLAWPVAALLGETGVGLRGEGDRALFESGGYLLLEILRLKGTDLLAVVRGLFPLLALGLALTAASNAALLVALNVQGRLTPRAWLARTFERWPALLALGIATVFGQGLLFGLGAIASEALPGPLSQPLLATAQQLGLWTVVATLAGALGGFSDVVKASFVRYESRLVTALGHASNCLRRRPLRTCLGWLPFGMTLLVAMLIAAQLTELLDVSRAGAWRVFAVFALHQLVVLGSVALRAGWYASALRLCATER